MKVSKIEVFIGDAVSAYYENKVIQFTRDNLIIWDLNYELLEDVTITDIHSYQDEDLFKIDFWGYTMLKEHTYLKVKITVTI